MEPGGESNFKNRNNPYWCRAVSPPLPFTGEGLGERETNIFCATVNSRVTEQVH
jgi:hypothetical protein